MAEAQRDPRLPVRLVNHTRDYVTTALIPPFPPQAMPGVLLWGGRVFLRPETLDMSNPIYAEAFGTVVVEVRDDSKHMGQTEVPPSDLELDAYEVDEKE